MILNKNIKTKITKVSDNNLKEASELSCCLHHVQVYVIYVQLNQLSGIDAFFYHELEFEHPSY